MTFRHTNIFSGVANLSSADLTVGILATLSPDGRTMVVATDANVALSPGGRVECAVVTPASAGQVFDGLEVGKLEPSQAPMVGIGNGTDFATRDALGQIVRSATIGTNTVGYCGADGSVVLDFSLARISTVIGAGGGALSAIVDYVAAAGDVVTSANSLVDASRKTLATTAALANGVLPSGVVLAAVPLLGLALYALPGATVPTTITGLGAGVATNVVVNSVGRPVRKDVPDTNDVVIGTVDTRGSMYVLSPYRPETSSVMVGMVPFQALNNGTVDISSTLRAAVAAAKLTDVILNFSSRAVLVPKGVWKCEKPIHIDVPGLSFGGVHMYASHLRSTAMCGPLLYPAPSTMGAFPHDSGEYGIAPNNNAAIIKHEVQVQNEHWLDLREYGAGAEWHGLAAFTLEMIVKIDNTTPTTRSPMLGSYGERASTDPLAQAMSCDYATSGGSPNINAVSFVLTTTVRTQVMQTPASSLLSDGSYHHLQFRWDGATMTVGIDGVSVALTAVGGGSASIGGTIVQQDFESVCFGGFMRNWGVSRSNSSADFHIAGIRISNTQRSLTALSGAKYTEDANTLFMCNFDTYDGIFVVGRSRGAAGVSTLFDTYLPHRRDNVTLNVCPNISVQDLSITCLYGIAVDMNSTPNSTVKRISTLSKTGVRMYNNCYKCGGEDIYMTGVDGRSGLALIGAANSMAFRNIFPSSFDADIVLSAAGDVTLEGSTYTTSANVHVWAVQCFNINISGNPTFSDEATTLSGRSLFTFMFFKTCESVSIVSGQWSQSETTGPLVTIQGDGAFGAFKYRYTNCFLGARNISSGMIDVKGTAPAGTIHIDDCQIPTTSLAVLLLTAGSADGVRVLYTPEGSCDYLAVPITGTTHALSRDTFLRTRSMGFTGVLAANNTVSVPVARIGERTYTNLTTGGFNVIVKATGGAVTYTLAAGVSVSLLSDGTELRPC